MHIHRYPVLLAIDDLQALYCETAYRDPRFAPIKSYHLSMPRLLLEFICGRKSFVSHGLSSLVVESDFCLESGQARGAVIGATTASDPLFKAPPELRQALGLDDQPPDPYTKMSSALKEYTAGLRSITVPDKLSVVEAAALFEVWMKDRALHSGTHCASRNAITR
jgi:small subunit ribosomal protein S29